MHRRRQAPLAADARATTPAVCAPRSLRWGPGQLPSNPGRQPCTSATSCSRCARRPARGPHCRSARPGGTHSARTMGCCRRCSGGRSPAYCRVRSSRSRRHGRTPASAPRPVPSRCGRGHTRAPHPAARCPAARGLLPHGSHAPACTPPAARSSHALALPAQPSQLKGAPRSLTSACSSPRDDGDLVPSPRGILFIAQDYCPHPEGGCDVADTGDASAARKMYDQSPCGPGNGSGVGEEAREVHGALHSPVAIVTRSPWGARGAFSPPRSPSQSPPRSPKFSPSPTGRAPEGFLADMQQQCCAMARPHTSRAGGGREKLFVHDYVRPIVSSSAFVRPCRRSSFVWPSDEETPAAALQPHCDDEERSRYAEWGCGPSTDDLFDIDG